MNAGTIIEWFSNCSDIVLGIALIAVGAAVVRPARPVAGWLVVAAGVINVLSFCCFQALERATDGSSGDPMVMSIVSRGVGFVYIIIYLGLIVAAAASLGAAKPAVRTGDSRPPMN